jgi:hypothetical protein
MLRTIIMAGLLYGYYTTGHVAYIIGAFVAVHIIQESIIGVVKEGTGTALQELGKKGGALFHEPDNETEID